MTKPKIEIVCGIELECEYNSRLIGRLAKNGYHSDDHSSFGDSFTIESDSSIDVVKFREGGGTAEIISRPFFIDEYDVIVNSFIKEARKRYRKTMRVTKAKAQSINFTDLINFNDSTGAHITFSVNNLYAKTPRKTSFDYKIWSLELGGKTTRLTRLFSLETCQLMRKRLFKAIKANFSPEFYDAWKNYYFRHYARRLTEDRFSDRFCDRYNEFNYCKDSGAIEWRSFHLNGVKTEAEFKNLMRLGFETLKSVLCEQFKKGFVSSKSECVTFGDSRVLRRTTEHALTLDSVRDLIRETTVTIGTRTD